MRGIAMKPETATSFLDDDALMRRLTARDPQALREIARRHGEVPYRIACRMLGDPAEGEDIAQEALLRLWNHAGKWQAGHAIAAWLTTVATNLCRDRLRRTRRLSGEEAPERRDEAPLADRSLAEEEMAQAVRECIGELPERARAAVVLTYYEAQPNRTVAELLEMKLKAFESMLLRARQLLQGCVEGKGVLSADVREIGA
jgi:RNA polymerase sigma-70 factor (ECF subfamily)